MDKSLECSICIGDFIQPKQLPCFHSFCLKCLSQYCKEELVGDTKPCPLCRKEFCIPEGGVKDFNSDKTIERLLIEKRLKDGHLDLLQAKCELCIELEEEVEAKHFCIECKQGLCDGCRLRHSKLAVSKLHKMVGIDDRPSEVELAKMKSSYCDRPNHSTKEIELYCDDCKDLICIMCYATSHSGHKCEVITEVAKIRRELSNKDSEELERCRAESMNKIKIVDKIQEMWKSTMNENQNEINGTHNRYLELLVHHKDRLQHKTEELQSERNAELKNQRELDQFRYVELDGFIAYSRMVTERGTDCEIIGVADKLHQRAEELIKSQDEYNKQVLTERTVTFVPASHPTEQQILDMLGRFLYTGVWENRELEVSSFVEAQWRGNAEVVESILISVSKALKLCNSTDAVSKIDDILIELQNNIKRMREENDYDKKLDITPQLFEHLSSATATVHENLDQKIKIERATSDSNIELVKSNSELKKTIDNLTKENSDLNTKNDILTKENNDLNTTNTALTNTNSDITNQNIDLTNKNNDLTRKADEISYRNSITIIIIIILAALFSQTILFTWNDTVALENANLTVKLTDITSINTDMAIKIADLQSDSEICNKVRKLHGTLRLLVLVGLYIHNDTSVKQNICHVNLDKKDAVRIINSTPPWIRIESTACVINNVLYVVGIGSAYNELWKWSVERDVWTRLADLPSGRRRHCATSVGEKIYVLGGWMDDDKKPLDSVLSYDINSDKWIENASLSRAVWGAVCVTYKHLIYVFGGHDDYVTDLYPVQVYDTSIEEVTKVLRFSNPMLDAHGTRAVLWGSKVLLVSWRTCYVYDLELSSWNERKRFKINLSNFGLTLSDDTLLISGGGIGREDEESKIVWTYSDEVKSLSVDDFISDNQQAEWKHHAKLPHPALVWSFNPEPLYRYI